MKSIVFTEAIIVLWVAAIGCGKSPIHAISTDTQMVSENHDHEGWWCGEHGVPEEICAQCSVKLAKQYKAKGDWCKQHDRPDSQCFICHPELQAKFAALYEAKYGAQPPKPELQ
jgi:cobalt-zinc-cadmium efflux system membrane fusion protein